MKAEPRHKITTRDIQRCRADHKPIVALTAYDAAMARFADAAGVDLILVGDSVGMTMLGYKTTIPVTLEQSLHHTAAVVRGTEYAMVIGDMPFLTCQISPEDALRNAGRYLQQAGADGVKLEGGQTMAPTVARLVQAGIPVLAHIGLLPQSVLTEGGYRIHGKTKAEATDLLADAHAVAEAGAFAIVLEGIPIDLSKQITDALSVPTIGIGAGPHCSGQIQVVNDILGLFEDFLPKHAKHYAHLAPAIRDAIGAYTDDVRSGSFPTEGHAFK